MRIIPEAPPAWTEFEAPVPPSSTELAIACVTGLRGCILLLSRYARSQPLVQKRGKLGRQSYNLIASLVARIHPGSRTLLRCKAGRLRVAVFLAMED